DTELRLVTGFVLLGQVHLNGRSFHETSHCHHQAVQAGRRTRVAVGNRRTGHHRHRSQRLRSTEGTHRAVSRCRVRRRLSAEGEDRRGDCRRPARSSDRGDHQGGQHRQDRRRQDLRRQSGAGHPHPYRRNRYRRDLSKPSEPHAPGVKPMTLRKFAGLAALLSLITPGLALAQEATLDSGDTAWMLTSTALVLFMTIPGLALFYAGMVRSKNVLSVMRQCFAITGLMSILWFAYGYSLAFSTEGMEAGVFNINSIVGSLDNAFLSNLTKDSLVGAFPESVFVTFQMTFAIITPALIVGAFAERMKFSAMLVFMTLWFTIVYAPMAHMVWGGDGALLWDAGVIDFAGGTVVHINAG